MHVLIVGAGSIGQLYGHFFQRGNSVVDVYVRPRYVDRARQGFVLYDRSRGLEEGSRFVPDDVLASPGDVDQKDYDAVVLCIPSTGLRGEWFKEFADAIGDATLVSLTPALKDRRFIAGHIGEDQFAVGMITAVAYPAPMEGEQAPQPGTAWWLPPLIPAYFEGPAQRLAPVMERLDDGGMKTRRVDDLARRAGFGAAVLTAFVATLEMKGWSFARLRGDREAMKLLAEATDEAMGAVELHLGQKRPLAARMLSPLTFSGALLAAPVVPPFELEMYLRTHFTKVGDQTRLMLHDYIDQRDEQGEDSPALQTLIDEIGVGPSDVTSRRDAGGT